MKILTIYAMFFLSLFFTSVTHYAEINPDWVSIANEFIKISLDKKTGRYIIYDALNYYQNSKNTQKINMPKYLPVATTIKTYDQEHSPILGQAPEALNFTTLQIDGTAVIFGSSSGRWIGTPILDGKSILYGWRLGNLDIIQRIEIVMNSETLYEDAVIISYDIKNNSTDNIRTIGARMILDPVVGSQKVPFFLPDKKEITTEYEAQTGYIPNYWISSDKYDSLSGLSVKGLLKSGDAIIPEKIYLTTMNKVLKDPWYFMYNNRNILTSQHTAVAMFYESKEILPQSTVTLASAIIAIPSLIESYGNNGLEVRTSSFVSKNTTPLNVDIWVSNHNEEFFDTVELTLVAPPVLEIFDSPLKKIYNISNLDSPTPVSWIVGLKENTQHMYDVVIIVKGYQNGRLIAEFNMPIVLNVNPNFKQNNDQELEKVINDATANIAEIVKIQNAEVLSEKYLMLGEFLEGDILGSDSENLSEIYKYLHSINAQDNKELMKMIEIEKQLLKDIQQTEKSIEKINQQYQILSEVYARLYKDATLIDREQVNIQSLEDNIKELEYQLKQQEATFSNLSDQFNSPLQFK